MKIFKKIIIAIALLIHIPLLPQAQEQSKSELKGDNLYDQYAFLAATNVYEKALLDDKDNARLKLKLAHCYRMLNEPSSTVKWYKDVIDDADLVSPLDQYYFAEALSGIGEFEEAQKWYESYSRIMPSDQRGKRYSESLNDLASLYRDSLRYSIEKLSINSFSDDFSPALYRNGIVFVSGRNKSIAKFNWNKSAFLDLYITAPGMDNDYAEPVKFHKKVNTRVHEGPVTFYDGDKKMIFTRNNYESGAIKKSSDGITKLKLFFAEKKDDGNWGEIIPFPFNNDEYSVGHPSITKDGNRLYFVSDMPGGYGGTDIYVSKFEGNLWSNPINLGPEINTEGDEMFPFISHDDHLYFASNGHGGLGGLDIFVFQKDGTGPINLGYPLNTNRDDFGLVLEDDGKKGYFSSNRIEGTGDDIFKVAILEPEYINIAGIILDAYTKEPVSGASVKLLNAYSNGEPQMIPEVNGDFEIPLQSNSIGTLSVEKAGYNSKNLVLNSNEFNEETNTITILLEPEGILLEGIARNKETGMPLAGASAVLTEKSKNTSKTFILDESGKYSMLLNPDKSYNLKIQEDKFFTKVIDIDPQGREVEKLNLDLEVEEIIVGKPIKIDNIYYDLNKWDIREDAALELDKLVKILQDNPNIKIELGSHTDARGSDRYNLYLSQKRATSAVDYVVSKDIDPERISSKGYGETKLINHCKSGVACSSEEHQENRRTEFMVTAY